MSDDQTLTLGLGFLPKSTNPSNLKAANNSHVLKDHHHHHDQVEPSLTLSLELSGETFQAAAPEQPGSAASSHSNNLAAAVTPVAVKRERQETPGSDEEEEDGSGGCGPTSTTRKKLRLTKDQSALLEDSFKQHTTLNPKQKQALADRLNLRPRQIEVWFQNRRARTKLKQTEMDCEQMKKYCETLTDENRRLQKELQELKALKLGQPSLYMHLAAATAPAATLTMCPSCCQRLGSGSIAGAPVPITPTSNNPLTFTLGPGSGSKPHFYHSFPNPSAAC